MFGFCGSLCGVFLYIVACLRGGRRKGRGSSGWAQGFSISFMQLHAVFHWFFGLSWSHTLFHCFILSFVTFFSRFILVLYVFFFHGFMRSFTVLWLRAGLGSFWGFEGSRLEGF